MSKIFCSTETRLRISVTRRIERQQAYVAAYVDLLKDRLASEPDQLWQEIGQMNDYLQTSITKNKYLISGETSGKGIFY